MVGLGFGERGNGEGEEGEEKSEEMSEQVVAIVLFWLNRPKDG